MANTRAETNPTFLTTLTEWTDVDGAQHEVARALGIVASDEEMRDRKALYWSDNETGNLLKHILDHLVSLGILETRDEPDIQYRRARTEDSARST